MSLSDHHLSEAQETAEKAVEYVLDEERKTISIPRGIHQETFEFAMLILCNLDLTKYTTVNTLRKKIDSFIHTYALSTYNVDCIKTWLKKYSLERKNKKMQESSKEDCWRFLHHVSARNCIKSIIAVFPTWLRISKTGDLTWNIS